MINETWLYDLVTKLLRRIRRYNFIISKELRLHFSYIMMMMIGFTGIKAMLLFLK